MLRNNNFVMNKEEMTIYSFQLIYLDIREFLGIGEFDF